MKLAHTLAAVCPIRWIWNRDEMDNHLGLSYPVLHGKLVDSWRGSVNLYFLTAQCSDGTIIIIES